MSDDQKPVGFEMIFRQARGDALITDAIAVEIARLILKSQHGQSALDRNEPLSATADGDAWIVLGRDQPQGPAESPRGFSLAGPFRMRISRFDGQIFECCFVMALPEVGRKFGHESSS